MHHTSKPNRLASCTSPYLLQHAYTPVDWYPWCTEAFERAKKENKPIFLSIGYSTCHWCHVMAHESFEDPDVAQLLNDAFICIKVDREERPDIDTTYMKVCQAMTGAGGWPLTIIMTSDKKPFFADTYLPKNNRYGKIGLVELISQIKNAWLVHQNEICASVDHIVQMLHDSANTPSGEEINETILSVAYQHLAERFDDHCGGFGHAPKFPTPHTLLFLLRYWHRTKNSHALMMVEKTLHSMRRGGIYDHVGFGFHRYATDSQWIVPHFEKMLYDQALLALAYLETYQATKKEAYAATAHEIFTYVLRDMVSPEGGFYCAEDADVDGKEGTFYTWSYDELTQILGKDATLIGKIFTCSPNGNYYEEATGEAAKRNILHSAKSLSVLAAEMHLSLQELMKRVASARQKLYTARDKRPHPHKDDKILADWNGLMIAALARGAQILHDERYAHAAQKAAHFILKNMCLSQQLFHCYRNLQCSVQGMIDDYAFLTWGLLELYETTFEISYLHHAHEFNNYLLNHFWDSRCGGFYFTADIGEMILTRSKEIYDGAIPSGNSVALLNLLRLMKITGDATLETYARSLVTTFSRALIHMPSAYTLLLTGIDFLIGPAYEIVIVRSSRASSAENFIETLRNYFIPNKIILSVPSQQQSPPLTSIAPHTADKVCLHGKTTAYICANKRCMPPTTSLHKMLEFLDVKPLSESFK